VSAMTGEVYLIHAERPLAHAQHYLGWTQRLESRLDEHASGQGSPLLRAMTAEGIGWSVAKVWRRRTRTYERKLKNRKNARALCPVCREESC